MKKFPFKVLAIMPILALGLLLWKYGVNLPVQDEWQTPGLALVQYHLNQLTWDDLIVQHNESRKVFPKLFFLFISRLTGWNTRYGMLASFLLACLTSFNIYHLSKITLNSTWGKRLICLALANLLIFSPMQVDNWLMGLQMITFVPIAAITSALAIIFSQNPLLIKLVASVGLATVATFSFSNGIISWLVIFPALALVTFKNKRSFALILGSWLFFTALIFAFYFHNYQSPAHHPSLISGLSQPIDCVRYFLAYIGSSLGLGDLISSQIVGLCILGAIAFCCFYLFKINPSQRLFYQAFPWLAIISYTLISGTLSTLGRVGFGLDFAISPRYITFSAYGIVGLIYLLAILVADASSAPAQISHNGKGVTKNTNLNLKSRGNKYARALPKISTLALVSFLLLYPANYALGLDGMRVNYGGKLYSKACLNLLYMVPDQKCFQQYLFPDPQFAIDRAVELDRLSLLRPVLSVGKTMQEISSPTVFEQVKYGQFDTLTKDKNNTYTAIGWAILSQYHSNAHAVVLAYQTADNRDLPFALVHPHLERADVALEAKVRGYRNSGWSKTFPQSLIPDDAVAVSAWAYDSLTGRAFKIERTHSLNNVSK